MVDRRAILVLVVAVLAWVGVPGADAAPPLKVVATTGMIADTARSIGGPAITVTALMGEGVDPHLYKASPGDVRIMSGAGLLLWNGLHLEGRLGDAITKLGSRVPVVCVSDSMPPDRLLRSGGAGSVPDPHVWFDLALWRFACERIRDAIIEHAPGAADGVRARCAAHLELLDTAAGHVRAVVASIPAERRLLVTAHDAFGYFGRANGLTVRGIQGLSTDSEASLRELNALVDLIVERKVPAVFIESSVPRKTVEALVEGCSARGHAVTIGGELLSDAVGAAGTEQGTHVGMVVNDAEVIARALGGTVPARPAALATWLDAAAGRAP
ncbi:MAG: manganese transporter [Planctomycetes bacterium]|nr:manganese transporter [Planctomycetota bacterium]